MAFTKDQEREYLKMMYQKAGLSDERAPKPKKEDTGFVIVNYIDRFEVKSVTL